MHRFFFEPEDRQGEEVLLCEEESRHAAKVLRLGSGAAVELLDGRGSVFAARIVGGGRRLRIQITSLLEKQQKDPAELWLAQGILKGEKMDTVVQKATELGVDAFIPLQTARCQGRLSRQQGEKKLERWRRICREACKQCRRAEEMRLAPLLTWDDFLTSGEAAPANGLRLMFWEEEQSLRLGEVQEIASGQPLVAVIGPEGGLSAEEIGLARAQGFRSISLGKRILRAETAALAAITIIQHRRGQM